MISFSLVCISRKSEPTEDANGKVARAFVLDKSHTEGLSSCSFGSKTATRTAQIALQCGDLLTQPSDLVLIGEEICTPTRSGDATIGLPRDESRASIIRRYAHWAPSFA